MIRNMRLLVLGLSFILAGCAFEPDYPSNLSDLVIRMERTRCFGTCPAYSLTIHGDGVVIYEGIDFVEVKGKQESKLSQEQVKALVDEFYKIDFFGLEDSYTASIIDLPSTTTSITIAGNTKSVYNYYGAPEKLIELENKIDEITNVQQWTN
jgi:hypothetical protein